ncbi:unnamed protein product [Sphagnum jensenii]|uniref:Mitochondrial import inner membrane translocase subunit Tim21 n=1 Tax=Sphagnum jensenii TaxID=128206 RepID=A0ABP0X9R8_9BRYO
MSWRPSITAVRKVGTYSYYCLISQFFFRVGGSRIIWFVAAAAAVVLVMQNALVLGTGNCVETVLELKSRGLSKQQEEDPFDSLTDKVPERPVTVAEGASYSLIILAGLAVAAAAACAVFKELIFQPREYVLCFPLLGS